MVALTVTKFFPAIASLITAAVSSFGTSSETGYLYLGALDRVTNVARLTFSLLASVCNLFREYNPL